MWQSLESIRRFRRLTNRPASQATFQVAKDQASGKAASQACPTHPFTHEGARLFCPETKVGGLTQYGRDHRGHTHRCHPCLNRREHRIGFRRFESTHLRERTFRLRAWYPTMAPSLRQRNLATRCCALRTTSPRLGACHWSRCAYHRLCPQHAQRRTPPCC
jgi:hypothetical protein